MAIDAATGTEIWHKTTSGSQPTTASPAIDPNRLYVYSYGVDGKAHKYQVGDGTEVTTGGWPETITLKNNVEKGASGLTVVSAGGVLWLYVVTDGYIGDGGDYQGHITTINLGTGAQTVFNTLCSNLTSHLGNGDCATHQSGIWGRGGAVYDAATDRVYIATGNGHYNASTGGFNWGDSTLALAHDGTGAGGGMPRDSYTPTNFQQLDDQDIDLGSISLVIMKAPAGSTVPHLGMQTGKDCQLRLINLDNMSGAGAPAHVGGELQLHRGAAGRRRHARAAGDVGRRQRHGVALRRERQWPFRPHARAQRLERAAAFTGWQKSNSTTSPIVANGVLYSFSSCTGGTCIVGRDPATGNALWTSEHVSGPHWQSPILVNGVVYAMDGSGKLWAFGLRSAAG